MKEGEKYKEREKDWKRHRRKLTEDHGVLNIFGQKYKKKGTNEKEEQERKNQEK